MKRSMFTLFLCLTGIILNIILSRLNLRIALPLYMDTIFTVSVTFVGGLFWGMLTGFLTNIIGHSIHFWGWEGYLFALCNIATAVITYLFIQFFPNELKLINQPVHQSLSSVFLNKSFRNSYLLKLIIERVVVLILLAFSLCFVMSILGGLISAFIYYLRYCPDIKQINNPASGLISFMMFSENMPIIIKEILSRIPINIIDRLIAAFTGYGIAFIASKLFKKFKVKK